jgi:EAL domain-containing protein (putative c-di-GMP-specific phosphodiesterase class I)
MSSRRATWIDNWFGGARVQGRGGAPLFVALGIALTIALCWTASYAVGGAGKVPPHWFYVPILFASSRFGHAGALLCAVVSGIVAGPLLPLDVEAGSTQSLPDWLGRLAFFVVIGQVMTWVMAQRQGAETQLHHTRGALLELQERMRSDEEEASRLKVVQEQVKEVLRGNGLSVVFQPLVDLRNGTVVAVEALSRFELDPRRPPNEWFADAWTVGLGEALEIAALRSALAESARLPAELAVSVNLAPSVVSSPRFVDLLPTMPCGRMVVEVTEHARVLDYEGFHEPLKDFRQRGGRLAIDDAGAGYASLRHILKLSPDIIKLDLDLTRGIDRDPARRALASAMIAFAAELGIWIVAEGIETQAELQCLQALGVHFGQGYYLAKPTPLGLLDLSPRDTALRESA